MAVWTIKGEAGKALDDTVRTLEELGIKSGSILRTESLGVDSLNCHQVVKRADLVGEVVPESGQLVELFHDTGTSRRAFMGYVTRPRYRWQEDGVGASWVVAGPDWWMRKVMLTGESADQRGNSRERPNFAFSEGALHTHITTLVNRAKTLGVPIEVGTIDNALTVPKITLSNQSCWNALGELLRGLPDAVAWFDYDVVGNPTLNVTRRDNATVLQLSQLAGLRDLDLTEKTELRVTGVDLKHVERDASQRTVYKEQLSGHDGTAQAGSPSTSTWADTASVIGKVGTAAALGSTGTVQEKTYQRLPVTSGIGTTLTLANGEAGLVENVGQLLKVIGGPGAGYPNRRPTVHGGSGYTVDREFEESLTTDSVILVGDDVVAITTAEADAVGNWIKITSGPGEGQERLIIAKNANGGATVDRPWDEDDPPDATSDFEIIAKNRIDVGGTGDDPYRRYLCAIVSGTGAGQVRAIVGGEQGIMTVSPNWDTPPDGTSVYSIGPSNEIELAAGDAAMVGQGISIDSGTGAGQHRTITAIDGTRATVDRDWDVPPDGTSGYSIGPRVIQLASGASESDGAFEGLTLSIESGTGAGQSKTCKHYNGPEKKVLVDSNWTTNPDATSVYKLGSGSPSIDRQVLAISGPELNAILPQDDFEEETVTTARYRDNGGVIVRASAAVRFDSQLDRINREYPVIDDFDPWSGAEGTYTLGTDTIEAVNPKAVIEDGSDDGMQVPVGFSYCLVAGSERDYWESLGFLTFEVRVRGHFRHVVTPKYLPGNIPAWVLEVQGLTESELLEDATTQEWWYMADFTFTAVNALLEGDRVFRPADYDFIKPPEGFAGALTAAQNFTPYQGSATVENGTPEPYPDALKKVVNVSGLDPNFEAMKGLLSGVEYTLGTGKMKLNFGPPARHNARDLIARMRRGPEDNIEYL